MNDICCSLIVPFTFAVAFPTCIYNQLQIYLFKCCYTCQYTKKGVFSPKRSVALHVRREYLVIGTKSAQRESTTVKLYTGYFFGPSRARIDEARGLAEICGFHRITVNANRSAPTRCLVNSTLDRCNRRKTVGAAPARFYHRSNISVGRLRASLGQPPPRRFSGVAAAPVCAPHARSRRTKNKPRRFPLCFGTVE